MSILRVNGLSTSFATEHDRVQVLDDVSFTIGRGETMGIVGESGCGKSITALSIMRLLPQPSGRIDSGEVWLEDQDLLQLPATDMRRIRGNRVAMIFQEPMTALNPVHKIGAQLQEPFSLHRPDLSRYDRTREAIRLLTEVGIPSPEQRLNEYPHQLSGGMRQRVMIAMALALDPALLIADEPTTALDVTIQAQVLELIQKLRSRHGTAVILITHDLGVIAETCSRALVMYAGRVVESASVEQLFGRPAHPYSRGLLQSIPRLESTPRMPLTTIAGSVPSVDQLRNPCRFAERCQYAIARCTQQRPSMEVVSEGQHAACFNWQESYTP